MTLFLVVASGLIAVLVPDIESAFGFFGAFGAVFIGIYFPFTLRVTLSEESWRSKKNLPIVIANVILCILTGSAAVVSAIRIVKPDLHV